jgi:hypothetical protein
LHFAYTKLQPISKQQISNKTSAMKKNDALACNHQQTFQCSFLSFSYGKNISFSLLNLELKLLHVYLCIDELFYDLLSAFLNTMKLVELRGKDGEV